MLRQYFSPQFRSKESGLKRGINVTAGEMVAMMNTSVPILGFMNAITYECETWSLTKVEELLIAAERETSGGCSEYLFVTVKLSVS